MEEKRNPKDLFFFCCCCCSLCLFQKVPVLLMGRVVRVTFSASLCENGPSLLSVLLADDQSWVHGLRWWARETVLFKSSMSARLKLRYRLPDQARSWTKLTKESCRTSAVFLFDPFRARLSGKRFRRECYGPFCRRRSVLSLGDKVVRP